MINKYMLFFTPACPKCPKIKEFMQEKDLEKEWVDAATPEGLQKARDLQVMGVPTVIFLDEEGNEVSRATDIDQVKRAVDNKKLSDV